MGVEVKEVTWHFKVKLPYRYIKNASGNYRVMMLRYHLALNESSLWVGAVEVDVGLVCK